jgi:hypothetical protein
LVEQIASRVGERPWQAFALRSFQQDLPSHTRSAEHGTKDLSSVSGNRAIALPIEKPRITLRTMQDAKYTLRSGVVMQRAPDAPSQNP